MSIQTLDEVITAVTQAPDEAAALAVMREVHSRALLLATADQLYIDADGRASATLRRLIAAEARA